MTITQKAKVAILLIAGLMFVAINQSPLKPKDPRQLAYEVWLSPIEASFHRGDVAASFKDRPITIRFASDYPEFSADWSLMTSGNSTADLRLLRILQLAREGQIFALPTYQTTAPAIRLEVERSGQQFSNTLSREQVENSLQAQSLIKLLEVYAGEASTPPELSQN